MQGAVVTYRPPPPLSALIEMLWYFDGCAAAGHRERVLPSGRFQLVFDLTRGRGAVTGMRSRYVEIDTAAIPAVMGAVFRPEGACGILRPAACEFYDRAVPLDLFWGPALGELGERLREAPGPTAKFGVLDDALMAAVRRRSARRMTTHGVVRAAVAEFEAAPRTRTIREFARDAGLSRRRFSQLFREQVGLTPKLYCRIRRFQQVVATARAGAPVDWAEVALEGGYCDQSHMANEFREFSGMSPSVFLAAQRPFHNHVRLD